MILFAKRASSILYNVLVGRRADRPFILPANVCPIVPLTFLKAGQAYEFVDIRQDSCCLDDQMVLEKIRKEPTGYSGILFARTYGIEMKPDRFFQEVKELNADLLVIDDKCLCVPEVKHAKESTADIELFSTGYSKYADLGWGGFAYVDEGFAYESHAATFDKRALDALTAQVEVALRTRSAFEYKETDWLDMATPEMTVEEYFANITAQLPTVAQHREMVNAVYRCNLPREIETVDDGHTWRYNVIVRQKERLLAAIFAAGLFASSHYSSLGGVFGEGRFDNAEGLHRVVVNLFNDFRFNEEQALRVCQVVRDHCQAWPSPERP